MDAVEAHFDAGVGVKFYFYRVLASYFYTGSIFDMPFLDCEH